MATEEAMPEGAKGPVLETTQKDFLQEAKSLIAQHYKRINENKTQGTSINVFKNKHQKPKTGKYIPFDIKRSEILNVVQEHRTVLRSISFPKETSKCSPLMEDSQQMASTEPHFPNLKEKYQSVDLFKREKVNLGKIMTDIESVSKKMEKEKQLHLKKSGLLEPLHSHLSLPMPRMDSSSSSTELLRDHEERVLYDWRNIALTRASYLPEESSQSLLTPDYYKDYFTPGVELHAGNPSTCEAKTGQWPCVRSQEVK